MKNWLFPQHDALCCPHCAAAVRCLAPGYSVREKFFDLYFREQRALFGWFSAIVLLAWWWPLGAVASTAMIWRLRQLACLAPLYVCPSCLQQLSYRQACPAAAR